MEEKILQTKKNGMVMLLLTLLGYAVTVLLFFYSIILLDESLFPGILLTILSIAYWVAGIFLLCGLKVLKPQEALVLTLFGDYIGTLKGQGFYWVNPFCTAVNPAAGTKLSQSGDVNSGETGMAALLKAGNSSSQTAESTSKKISLKMMTLNNSRQKINDCLGNPVEIGIAVIWRVTDTAKAVFNVDNYKEYLSLQCDSALRNVVRVYPYDVAPNVDTTGDGVADEGSLRSSAPPASEIGGRGWHRPWWKPARIAGDRSRDAAAPRSAIIDAEMIVDRCMVKWRERLNECGAGRPQGGNGHQPAGGAVRPEPIAAAACDGRTKSAPAPERKLYDAIMGDDFRSVKMIVLTECVRQRKKNQWSQHDVPPELDIK